jgi:5-carboxymethyl-2-hydroxymuconate isomerase
MLSGRSNEERKQLADAVLAALSPAVSGEPGMEIQLSVETVDLDRPSYAKAVIHG